MIIAFETSPCSLSFSAPVNYSRVVKCLSTYSRVGKLIICNMFYIPYQIIIPMFHLDVTDDTILTPFFQKWLEVSSKRRNGPPCCELCQYQYLRHKKFVVKIINSVLIEQQDI